MKTQDELRSLFREAIPESNYKECYGCHTGSHRCAAVHTLHKICPCNGCVVKTSCTDYCEEYLYSLRMAAVSHKRGKLRITEYSNAGYIAILKFKGQKIQWRNRLWRHMDDQTKELLKAGYHV